MKKLILVILFATSLLSMDIFEAVKLGLENNSGFMDVKNLNQVDKKLDIRLVYLAYLENRDRMTIIQKTIDNMSKFKNSKQKYIEKKEKIESDFLDSKSVLELVINKKIRDIYSVERIDFLKFKNQALKYSTEVQSLENELNNKMSEKTDSSWDFDVSGEAMYDYEIWKRSGDKKYKQNEVELNLNIVLSRNSGHENDSTIEKAKKQRNLENKKRNIENDIKKQREDYVVALKEYKLKKENTKQYNGKSFQTAQKVNEAYNAYMGKNEALYRVYRKYAYLLHAIKK